MVAHFKDTQEGSASEISDVIQQYNYTNLFLHYIGRQTSRIELSIRKDEGSSSGSAKMVEKPLVTPSHSALEGFNKVKKDDDFISDLADRLTTISKGKMTETTISVITEEHIEEMEEQFTLDLGTSRIERSIQKDEGSTSGSVKRVEKPLVTPSYYALEGFNKVKKDDDFISALADKLTTIIKGKMTKATISVITKEHIEEREE
ncbi:hypothetical protein K7X08_017269 [Anisodus acutangulus]|uniref:Uncharacterized protein n=1 Tax=Anisodus acutangulus TaxID=402998 RepID=A0A9Q1LTF8_9SOLA|nr:hypothetical protein K7X08_017269 [Anisodus acutangulus]